MAHPLRRGHPPLAGQGQFLRSVHHLRQAIQAGKSTLAVVQHHLTHVNEIAVGNFVVTGGDLGSIRSDNAVGLVGRGEDRVRREGFDWFGGGKGQAIALGLEDCHQRRLIR